MSSTATPLKKTSGIIDSQSENEELMPHYVQHKYSSEDYCESQ